MPRACHILKQPFTSMKIRPSFIKALINLWPPFLGAGIRVKAIAHDWQHIEVRMRLGMTNRNYVGVHFGGSLYAMTDPFFMLMLINTLGKDYIVWDKAGNIDYIKPGKGVVKAVFSIDTAMLENIRKHTQSGEKHLPELSVDVCDEKGELVARVRKTLYIRKKLKV
ncbi:DUF4442 domain-containing protein [Craterilacuibacter sp. RT1T]|uniref:DUF4442 domain-containing protein n=1 Tax=Craterilacuibacter sp. RT1T TaxID=2942211 RepID=UPI0020BEAB41|nr:DUF4442 domain-containing protein [Craterilacuibacter sp. RT1T]MCL6262229.1 DUF4442 domain-containing protein [Craterilacuibacter sp. RT1T]